MMCEMYHDYVLQDDIKCLNSATTLLHDMFDFIAPINYSYFAKNHLLNKNNLANAAMAKRYKIVQLFDIDTYIHVTYWHFSTQPQGVSYIYIYQTI